MEEKIIIAGFGGQGIILAGNVLAQTALSEKKEIAAMASYGAEVRGGTANCTIVISDIEIASPVFEKPSTAILFNQPSLDKFENDILKGGLLVVNESMISREPKRKDITVVKVKATEIANELGNVKATNMVMLGAYIQKKGILHLSKVIENMAKSFPKSKQDLVEINIAALKKGQNLFRLHKDKKV